MRDLSSDENSSAADGDKKCSLLSLFVHDIALCVMLLHDIALSVMLLHVAALRVSVNVSGSVVMQCSRAPCSTKGFLSVNIVGLIIGAASFSQQEVLAGAVQCSQPEVKVCLKFEQAGLALLRFSLKEVNGHLEMEFQVKSKHCAAH